MHLFIESATIFLLISRFILSESILTIHFEAWENVGFSIRHFQREGFLGPTIIDVHFSEYHAPFHLTTTIKKADCSLK